MIADGSRRNEALRVNYGGVAINVVFFQSSFYQGCRTVFVTLLTIPDSAFSKVLDPGPRFRMPHFAKKMFKYL
jgi:hypothetical protein